MAGSAVVTWRPTASGLYAAVEGAALILPRLAARPCAAPLPSQRAARAARFQR